MAGNYLLGVDCGTYYTKVAYLERNGKIRNLAPRLLNLEGLTDSEGFIPSLIFEDSIGQTALEKFRQNKSKELKRGFKTQIHTEEGKSLVLQFLRILNEKIRERLRDKNLYFKFSLPAGWKKVGEKAELYKEIILKGGFILNGDSKDEKLFLSEPYAAAAYYLREGSPVGNYLVIDAGAGTIDCAIVSITERKGNIKIEEIENTLESFEKAGTYIDTLIDETYKIGDLFIAEDIKVRASKAFSAGQAQYKQSEPPVIVEKNELESVLSDWLDELREFLLQYINKFERGNILLTGGLGNFYFLKELVKRTFDVPTLLPSEKEAKHLQRAVSFGCVLELAGFIETVELVNYSVKIPISYPLADKIKEIHYRGKSLNFEVTSSCDLLIEIISPIEQTGACAKRLSEIILVTSYDKTRLSLNLLGSFMIIAEDKDKRRETDSIEIEEFSELEPTDFEVLVDRDNIPKLRVIGKEIKTFEFRKLSKNFSPKNEVSQIPNKSRRAPEPRSLSCSTLWKPKFYE